MTIDTDTKPTRQRKSIGQAEAKKSARQKKAQVAGKKKKPTKPRPPDLTWTEQNHESGLMRNAAPKGRPPTYHPGMCEIAYNMSLLGATDTQLAVTFGVDVRTIDRWKVDHPDFCQSLIDGKVEADAKVAKALYQRALGFSHPEFKVFNNNGEPMVVEMVKHHPPDTSAAMYWLQNRQAGKWRQKVDLDLGTQENDPIRGLLSALAGKVLKPVDDEGESGD